MGRKRPRTLRLDEQVGQRLALLADELGGSGAPRGEADLLTEHGAHGQLVAVDRTRHPQAGACADERPEHRVAGERVTDRDRVAVGVEESAYALHGGAEVAQVGEPEGRRHESGEALLQRVGELEGDQAGAVRKRHRARVRRVVGRLDAGHHVGGEEDEQGLAGERRPHRQPELEGATGRAVAPPPAQLGRGRGVDLADGVVELTDAREARRERHVGGTQLRRLEQDPRGLRALGAGQGQRAGPELLGEESGQVARGVADAVGQALDAVAVDDPVGDQPHRATRGIGRDVPVGAARRGVGEAALAGAVAGRLSGCGGRVERDVLVPRGAGRARRPAVDARRPDRDEEHPVEAPVAALHRPVAGLGVQVHRRGHVSIMADPTDSYSRESDTAVGGPAAAVGDQTATFTGQNVRFVTNRWSATDGVDEFPREREQPGGKEDLDRVTPEERLDAEVPGLRGREVERVCEPGGTERVDDDVAEHHRRERADGVAVPAAVGEPAHDGRGDEHADEVPTGGGAEAQDVPTGGLGGEDADSQATDHEVRRHRREAAGRAVGTTDQQHPEGLAGDRDGRPRQVDHDLGGQRDQRHADGDEDRVGGECRHATARTDQRRDECGGGHGEPFRNGQERQPDPRELRVRRGSPGAKGPVVGTNDLGAGPCRDPRLTGDPGTSRPLQPLRSAGSDPAVGQVCRERTGLRGPSTVGTPDRIRTGATALRGRRARPLHNGGKHVNTRGETLANRLRTHKIPAWAGIFAGVLGLEPRLTGPEPVVLPITPYPNG